MNSLLRSSFLFAGLALGGFSLAVLAQEKTAPPAESSAPADAPSPSALAPAAVAPAPTPPPVAMPASAREGEAPLRRLDAPDAERSTADELRQRAEDIRERTRARREEERAREDERRRKFTGHKVIVPFGNANLARGERADQVVAIFGNATAEGEVADSVVAVFGNSRATAPVGDSVVAIFGNASVEDHVRSVVAVFGNVHLGPNAVVDDEVVCIAGTLTRDPQSIVRHQITNVGIPFVWGHGSATWFQECLLKGRPLAFDPGVRWAWVVAFTFFGCYLLLAVLFPGAVARGVETLERHPGYSILAAICTVVLAPITTVLLCVTVIGIVVVPFLGTALILSALFGKVVMLAWLGGRFTRLLSDGSRERPVFAVLIGGLIMMGLYSVPVLGVLMFMIVGWLGLGVIVYSVLSGSRREKPPASRPFVAPAAATGIVPPIGMIPPMVNPPVSSMPPEATPATPPLTVPVPPLAAPMPPVGAAMILPRAGFWIRVGALAIDGLLVLGLCLFLNGALPREAHLQIKAAFFPVLAAYGAVLWKLRGTTVGGIVCSLKVVRVDSREIDWATAIVRALGCFLSMFVAGLGFIWVAIDDEKQSWHDKIAGTAVVRAPKGMSLL
jgi:uncharacterized RDD family membrane protein YckC